MFEGKLRLIRDVCCNTLKRFKVYFVAEGTNWSIWCDGLNVTTNLPSTEAAVTTTAYGIRNAIVHYGSINTFIKNNQIVLPHKSNKVIVT